MTYECNIFVIVFPVYMWGLPNIIREFLENIHLPKECKIYSIVTNAGIAGNPNMMVKKILGKGGYRLSGGYCVWMPENFIARYNSWPNWVAQIVLNRVPKKIDKIINDISNGKNGVLQRTIFPLHILLTIQNKILVDNIYIRKTLKVRDFFWVNNECKQCGMCLRICPRENIQINNENLIVFGDNCEICVGCIQWCPEQAIQSKNVGLLFRNKKATLKRKRYHNPEVTINDFILR